MTNECIPLKSNYPLLVQHFVPTKVLDTGINNAHDGGRCVVNDCRQFIRGQVLNLDVSICETMTQDSLHRLQKGEEIVSCPKLILYYLIQNLQGRAISLNRQNLQTRQMYLSNLK